LLFGLSAEGSEKMEKKQTICATCRFFLRHPNRDEPHSYCGLRQVRVHAGETCDEWEPNNQKGN